MDDPEQVVLEAIKRRMRAIIVSIPDPKDVGKIIHLKNSHPTFVYLCLGFHPNALEEYSDTEIDEYINSIESERYEIVGVGEIGLEYKMGQDGKIIVPDDPAKERMFSTFEKFIASAERMDLPVVIHIRNAMTDALDILEKHKPRDVVLHCFSGSEGELKRALKNNYWISFGTNICYTKKYPRLASVTPLDRMLLETDAPWNDPDTPKELVNRPWKIERAAEVIAKLHNTTKEEVLRITMHNAKNVFGIL